MLAAYYCETFPDKKAELLKTRYRRKDGQITTVDQSLVGALGWIESKMNASDLGLVEFKSTNPHGLQNQTWTDSDSAYLHEDGEMANHLCRRLAVLSKSLDNLQLYKKYPNPWWPDSCRYRNGQPKHRQLRSCKIYGLKAKSYALAKDKPKP